MVSAIRHRVRLVAAGLLMSLLIPVAQAADYPAPEARDWIAPEFRFHTGQVIKDVRLHYTTVGAPTGEPVLILHGTGGSGSGLLSPAFAGQLFGPGQPVGRDAGDVPALQL